MVMVFVQGLVLGVVLGWFSLFIYRYFRGKLENKIDELFSTELYQTTFDIENLIFIKGPLWVADKTYIFSKGNEYEEFTGTITFAESSDEKFYMVKKTRELYYMKFSRYIIYIPHEYVSSISVEYRKTYGENLKLEV